MSAPSTDSEDDSESFGALLFRHRTIADLNQAELAEAAGLSTVSISALERGVHRAPHRGNVARLAQALKLSAPDRARLEAAANADRGRVSRREPDRSAFHNFPNLPGSFIGRTVEIRQIADMLKRSRLVTLTGPGGVGKTRLAVEFVSQSRESPRDGVWFVDLSAISNRGDVIPRILSGIGARPTGQLDPVVEITQALSQRRLLMILDNCEHVLAEVKRVVARVLPDCPSVAILTTSRERLGITAELVYRIPTLPVPSHSDARSAVQIQSYPAIQLFVDRATSAQQQFELTDPYASMVAEICRRLDGIPLAIEMAAARLGTLGLPDLLIRLDRFLIEEAADRDSGRQQQTARTMIEWSWSLLDEQERMLFRRLAIFVDGWTLESAEAVCSDDAFVLQATVLDRLASLVDKSLVTLDFEGSQPRYRFLVVTRQFAVEALEQSGEWDAVALRHLEYLRLLFERSGTEYMRTFRQSIVMELEVELTDARSALQWASDNGQTTTAAALFTATPLWYLCGLHAEELRWATAFLTALPDSEPRLRALLTIRLSKAADSQGQSARALEAAAAAVRYAREGGDPLTTAMALSSHGFHLAMTQEFEAAATAFEEAEVALRIADEQDLPTIVTRANLLQFRGHSARLHGDHDKASRAYELLCALCRSLGNTHLEILTTIALSKCAVECGDIDRAISLIVRALPSAEPRSRPELQATLLAYLSALLAQRSVVEAQEMATRVLRLVADKPAQIPIAIVAIETVALTLVLSDSPHHSAARLAGFCDAYIRGIAATREDIEDINYRSLHDRLREIFTSSELGLLFAMGANLTPSEAIMEAIGN